MTEFACCPGSGWAAIIDLGSALGFDCILGRCAGCGGHWMNVWSALAPPARYLPVAGDVAGQLVATPAGAARKRALADWLEAR